MTRIHSVINALTAIALASLVGVTLADFIGFSPIYGALGCSFLSLILPTSSSQNVALKVLWGAGVVDGRGKLNGWVFAKNRAGNYARVKVTPSNPQSEFQLQVRSSFGAFAQQWRGLTQLQRDGWNALAQGRTYQDIFGNSKQLTGLNMYVLCNQNLANINRPAISDAPSFSGVPAILDFQIAPDSAVPELIMDWSSGAVPAGFKMLVYATPCVSAGVKFTKGKQRVIAVLAASTATGVDVNTEYEDRLGSLVQNKNVCVYARLVDDATGEAGLPTSSLRPVA